MTGADSIQKAVDSASKSATPRQIRAQIGQTEDPLPEGKSVAEPEHHFDVEPASHGASDQNKAEELSKEDIKGHKDELKHIQNKEQRFQSDSNAVGKTDPQKSAAGGKTGRESR